MKKRLLLIGTALFLLFSFVSAQRNVPAQHSLGLEVATVPFFFVPVPRGVGAHYEHYWENAQVGLSGGFMAYPGLDGNPITVPVRVKTALGKNKHWFEPNLGVAFWYEDIQDNSGQFRTRRISFTPEVDLLYRFQAREDGFFLKAGPHFWFPPFGQVVLENNFLGDGKYDDDWLRVLFVVQGGWSF